MTQNHADILSKFPETFQGPVLRPGEEGYTAARSIFNMRLAHEDPALIARAVDADDVVTAVRFAADSGIPLAIRSGGHGVDGTAMPGGGLVLDTSLLKRIDVDPRTRVAKIDAGVLLGELDGGLQRYGLVVPAGTVSTTGVAGLTLGGGVGYLMRRFGATVDNLLACDVVTTDGRKVRASAEENPDLFWGLRGGGANLGVVTRFEYRAHELGPDVTSGLLVFGMDEAAQVLDGLAHHMRTAPRELGVIASMAPCPPLPSVPEQAHGQWVLLLVVVWTGDQARAGDIVAPLVALGRPLANLVQPTTWVETNRMLDVVAPYGHRAHTCGGYLTDLTDGAVAVALEHTRLAPPPADVLPPTIINFWAMGGAISNDFAEDSVAFSREGAGWFWETLGQWDGEENDAAYVAWVDGVRTAMRPHLRANGYVNLSVDQGPKWLRGLYGSPAKFARLAEAKTAWDPGNMLRFNKNIAPAKAGT
ncbi:FAD-binding oxidoreductase [Streptomyces sp. T028]|uniref:FAD-binding oxidoreductase n=1 Tax=Streptomyces sp. T028 TaxID=3394379 RepID=UPI003A85E0CD